VGAIFDRVFYEGNPRNDWAGLQTVPFGAQQRRRRRVHRARRAYLHPR
jgi:hypothetical protein